jgi:hypothetical protein
MSEWLDWYRGYENEGPLTERLQVVQRLFASALDDAPPGPIRVISMCAGDGRDVIGALSHHPRRLDVVARLVELEPELVEQGRTRAAEAAIDGVAFVVGDASTTTAYSGAAPADIVLVCGVFGNISDDDIHRTIDHLPHLCSATATVIWTRGRFAPDLTPTIREWFADAGFDEVEFVAIPDTTVSVGSHRLTTATRPFQPGVRLFTFLPRSQRPSRRSR